VHPPGLLLIVADGMGGTMAGEMASQMCVELLPELLRKRLERKGALGADAARHALVAAVEETHQRILGRASARPECKGMGTTCTAALVDGSLARIAQVGDSRAYLYRRGKIAQLTRDQTVWETMRNGEEEPGPEFKDAPWKNMLVQAVGAQPALEVAVTEHALESDDWLLLCSDGLYRVVKAEELAAELKSKRDPAEKARRLAELANQRGGPDNVSVVVCHVAEAGG
jgi:protein phosphatase